MHIVQQSCDRRRRRSGCNILCRRGAIEPQGREQGESEETADNRARHKEPLQDRQTPPQCIANGQQDARQRDRTDNHENSLATLTPRKMVDIQDDRV